MTEPVSAAGPPPAHDDLAAAIERAWFGNGAGLIEPPWTPEEIADVDDEQAAQIPRAWPEPEDRGGAVLSSLGDVEYAEDLIRPGRIVVVAAEEGTGKSYAVDGELGIRVAVAGGSFAGTWRILRTGPVLVMSEMHGDDDWHRETEILASLGLERKALEGCYYRLQLQTAAGGSPALMVAEWRAWVTAWLRDRGALLLVIDTATRATQVDPWGKSIQAVFDSLAVMLADYPELAIVLVVHLKKPQGKGGRVLSDVLGEWSRHNDVTVLLEGDGKDRLKISTAKRIRKPRRIVATKAGGLLIDPHDLDEVIVTKVPLNAVVSAIVASPGIGQKALARALDVSSSTAAKYAEMAEEAGLVYRVDLGRGKGFRLYPGEDRAGPPPSKGPEGSSERGGPSLDGGGEGPKQGTVQPSNQPVGLDGPLIGPPPSGSLGDEMAGIFGHDEDAS